MKRTILIALALVVLTAAGAAAQTVVNTLHDLSTYITGASQQVCVFCHTPHGSNVDAVLQDAAPLWNHDLSATSDFGQYTSDTMNATAGAITDGTYSIALLCMSCHDGTVALQTMYNSPNNVTVGTIGTITGDPNLGTSLSTHHPVEFAYQDSIDNGDDGLNAADSQYLINGNVTCSSCHEPHDQGIVQDATVNFMMNSLDGSQLCLVCHDK